MTEERNQKIIEDELLQTAYNKNCSEDSNGSDDKIAEVLRVTES